MQGIDARVVNRQVQELVGLVVVYIEEVPLAHVPAECILLVEHFILSLQLQLVYYLYLV